MYDVIYTYFKSQDYEHTRRTVTVTRTTSSKDPEVFQVETLNTDTFTFPSTLGQRIGQWWKKDADIDGQGYLFCSVQ